jgi:type II secretion system protein G
MRGMNSHLRSHNRRSAKILIFIRVGILTAGLAWIMLHPVVLHWNGNWRVISSAEAKRHRWHIIVVADIAAIKVALNRYKSTKGHYPRTEQGLRVLVTQPIEPVSLYGGRTLLDSVPKDPWGSEYIYFCPGKVHPDTYDLYSAGPDRVADTADDDWGN